MLVKFYVEESYILPARAAQFYSWLWDVPAVTEGLVHQDVGSVPSRKRAHSEPEPGAFTVVSTSDALVTDGDDNHDPSPG